MSDLETLTLTEKRPELVHIGLGAVYCFFLCNGIFGLVLAWQSDVRWLAGLMTLFSIPLMGFCLHLLKMNRNPELILTPTGLSERTEIDYRAFQWSDIEQFGVYRFRARFTDQARVGFIFSDSFRTSPAYKKVRLTAKAERLLTGYDWHLSNLYGNTPEQLAAQLNQYRKKVQL